MKVMQETALVSKDMDGCLGGVTRYFNKKMWKEAADAGGDYSKVATHAELSALGIGEYAPGAKVGRFAQHEMWKHHAAVQAWTKEYLRAANPARYGSWANADARWVPVMDGMPAIALPMRQHTRAGGAAFHSILPHSPGDAKLPSDPAQKAAKILEELNRAYGKWDELLPGPEKGLGQNISVVTQKWLRDKAL